MYDVAVIGLGGMGSSTVYHLSKRGANVIGFDQFSPPHDQGSTHGRTRLIRQAYFEHPNYVPLIRRAYELWSELSTEWKQPLFHQVGLLEAGPREGTLVSGVRQSASEHHLTIENLSPKEARSRFPGITVPEDMDVVFEPTAGILEVEHCVEAALSLAQSYGAILRFGEPVIRWEQDGQGFAITTPAGRTFASRLVVAGGPWGGKLLSSLSVPLLILRKTLHWFATIDTSYDAAAGFPAFLVETGHRYFYGFPVTDELGLKVAEHSGGDVVDDPSVVERQELPSDRASVREFLERWLPKATQSQTAFATCLYTMSPDENFIVGEFPSGRGVYFIAGLSGHGFKFASVMGEVLTDLALNGRTDHPIEFLSPLRFRT
ncbi:N-methyl-L-tryptophan oxidase [bacterium]|nr:N-methyl-L-tryptophan oxidase [bacterium]